LRKITGVKKIGHAGTLDPFASGLLICAIGREVTREISKFVKLDKEYLAGIFLGAVSDTYDRTGKIIRKLGADKEPSSLIIKNVLRCFVDRQKQVPPMYSAKKVGGRKLYQLARAGQVIKREPTKIKIFDIKLLKYKWPGLNIRVRCSSGTYIRSLAHDIGKKLGCGAYLNELERTAIGDYRIENSIEPEKLNRSNITKYLFS